MALRLLARPIGQQLLMPRVVPGSTRLYSKRHRGNGHSIQDSRQDRAPASSQSGHPSPSPTPDEAPIEPPASSPPPSESEASGPTRTEPAATPGPSAEPEVLSLPSLDFAPGEQPRTGARPRGSPAQTPGQRLAGRLFTFALVAGAGATIWQLGRDWEEEELKKRRKEPLPTGSGFLAFWQRVKTRAMGITGLFSEPAWEDLLPPPLPPPHQKPYTLLLSIDDLLVTSTWDRQHGWRTAKRPGVDYFLGYLSQFYEIVIFTSQPFYHAGPISEKLDPYQFYVMYRLFREATRFVDGKVVKDISFLNRDLSKVVALDTHPEHYALQPENALIVPPWTGEAGDKGLVALIPFLESIGIYKPQDVRPILKKYAGKDVAVEYAKQEAEHKRAFLEDWRAKNAGRAMPGAGLSSGGFTLSSLFGGSGPSLPHGPEPMTYLEQKRAEAQRNYLDEQAYLKQNEGEIKRLMEEDLKERERLAKEQGGSIFAMMGALMHGPPGLPAPGPAQTQATAEAAGKK